MRFSDIVAGLVLALAALAAVFFVIPAQIGLSEDFGLNPRIFPLTVMWLGAAVALILVVVRLRQPREAEDEPGPMQGANWIFIVAISAFLAASYFAIELIGFLVTAPLIMAVLMLAMGEYRHPIRLVIVALALPVSIYYSFGQLFAIQLP